MIWYPYEQMKTMKEPYRILDAEGVHLYTKDQKLIDSISSWWCMIPVSYTHLDVYKRQVDIDTPAFSAIFLIDICISSLCLPSTDLSKKRTGSQDSPVSLTPVIFRYNTFPVYHSDRNNIRSFVPKLNLTESDRVPG